MQRTHSTNHRIGYFKIITTGDRELMGHPDKHQIPLPTDTYSVSGAKQTCPAQHGIPPTHVTLCVCFLPESLIAQIAIDCVQRDKIVLVYLLSNDSGQVGY